MTETTHRSQQNESLTMGSIEQTSITESHQPPHDRPAAGQSGDRLNAHNAPPQTGVPTSENHPLTDDIRDHTSGTDRDFPVIPPSHTRLMSSPLRPPAPRPCASCPYRRDVPSGIWAHEEYDKLRRYDAPTAEQPAALFQCHQADADSDARRICAGWAGCHDGAHLLALRIARLDGRIDATTHQAVAEYTSPIPLFASGDEAAAHGQADIELPSKEAVRLIAKISRSRGDLRP